MSIGSLPSYVYVFDFCFVKSVRVSSKDLSDLPLILGVGMVKGDPVTLSSLLTGLGLELLGPPLVRT